MPTLSHILSVRLHGVVKVRWCGILEGIIGECINNIVFGEVLYVGIDVVASYLSRLCVGFEDSCFAEC